MSTQSLSNMGEAHDRTVTVRRGDAWLWLTVPIAVFVAIVSGIGLLVPGFYRVGWYLGGFSSEHDQRSLAPK